MNPILFVYEKQNEKVQIEALEKLVLEQPERVCEILGKAKVCKRSDKKYDWLDGY